MRKVQNLSMHCVAIIYFFENTNLTESGIDLNVRHSAKTDKNLKRRTVVITEMLTYNCQKYLISRQLGNSVR